MRFFAAMLSCLFAGAALAQNNSDPYDAAVRLGLDIDFEIMDAPNVRRSLQELRREPCDKTAIDNLGRALERAGYRRDAVIAYIGFSKVCGDHAPSLRSAVNVLLKLSDYETAASIATDLIRMEPYNDNGYFLRGMAYFEGKQPRKAIDDFVTAIELFGQKDRISSVSYVNMSRAYEQLGQYCDAIVPLEAWVRLNPARNDTSQVRSMIASLAAKGRCPAPTGSDEVVPLNRSGNVVTLSATINGTPGKFIFDTGATFVALRRSFAEKAKVDIDEGSGITLHTANGATTGKRGRAKLIQMRSIKAEDVAIVVQTDQKALFGDGVDGLLGMSFLSRFEIAMDGRSLRLKPRRGR